MSSPTWSEELYSKFAEEFPEFKSFRPGQEEALTALVEKEKDVLAVLPTGSGKTLIIQMASIMLGGVTLVVVPTKELIHTTTEELVKMQSKIQVIPIGEDYPFQNDRAACSGHGQIVVCCPEKLTSLSSLSRKKLMDLLTLLVIDEAHLVYEWQSFRPAYTALRKLWHTRSYNILALTGTANAQVQTEVAYILDLSPKHELIFPPLNRPNLSYSVFRKTNPDADVVSHCRNFFQRTKDQSAIIFVPEKVDATKLILQLCEALPELSHRMEVTHASMCTEHRERVVLEFVAGNLALVVSTKVFGLGINCDRVGLVICYGTPESVAETVQMWGRAGRAEGLAAKCMLFYTDAELSYHQAIGDDINEEIAKERITSLNIFCRLGTCRRAWLSEYFGQAAPHLNPLIPCCDNCTFLSGLHPKSDLRTRCVVPIPGSKPRSVDDKKKSGKVNLVMPKDLSSSLHAGLLLFIQALDVMDGEFSITVVATLLGGGSSRTKELARCLQKYKHWQHAGSPIGNPLWYLEEAGTILSQAARFFQPSSAIGCFTVTGEGRSYYTKHISCNGQCQDHLILFPTSAMRAAFSPKKKITSARDAPVAAPSAKERKAIQRRLLQARKEIAILYDLALPIRILSQTAITQISQLAVHSEDAFCSIPQLRTAFMLQFPVVTQLLWREYQGESQTAIHATPVRVSALPSQASDVAPSKPLREKKRCRYQARSQQDVEIRKSTRSHTLSAKALDALVDSEESMETEPTLPNANRQELFPIFSAQAPLTDIRSCRISQDIDLTPSYDAMDTASPALSTSVSCLGISVCLSVFHLFS
jgi:ATP-dependent DNA helicase RecQ